MEIISILQLKAGIRYRYYSIERGGLLAHMLESKELHIIRADGYYIWARTLAQYEYPLSKNSYGTVWGLRYIQE